MSQHYADDPLTSMIEQAQVELLRVGLDRIPETQPHVLQLALAGWMAKQVAKLLHTEIQNGNGNVRRKKAVQVALPVGTGGLIVAVVEYIRLVLLA